MSQVFLRFFWGIFYQVIGQIIATADNEGDTGGDMDDAVFTQDDTAWFDSGGGAISVSSYGNADSSLLDAGTGDVSATSATAYDIQAAKKR